MRVLIVDDQEFIRRGVRAVLSETKDIEVCGEATDGREAVAKALQLKPDLIIMDISMPRMDGLQATRRIRRVLPKVRVMTLSQYDEPEIIKEAMEAGAATHVSKLSVWTKLLPALRRVELGDTFLDTEEVRGAEVDADENLKSNGALERALRDSEERFRSTFELTAIGIGHVAEDGRWLRVNQKLCEMMGYRKEEIQKLTFQDLSHPAELAEDLAQTKRVVAGEIDHYSIEKRYIRKDGGIVWIHLTVHAVRNTEGKLKYCIRVAEDIAARKEAEAKLAQAKRDWQTAMDHLDLVATRMALALTHCSRDLHYVWVNQNYANWLERPVEKIVGRAILDVLGKQAFQTLRDGFDQVLAGQTVEYEGEAVYEGIGSRRVSAAYRPTLDAEGVADGWIAMIQDITQHRHRVRASRCP